MRITYLLAGFSFLIGCGTSAGEPAGVPDAPATPLLIAPPPGGHPAAKQAIVPARTDCGPEDEPLRGAFAAGPSFQLTRHNEVTAAPMDERAVEEPSGVEYQSVLDLTFYEPIASVTHPQYGVGRRQDFVRYQVTLASPSPRADPFASGTEQEARVGLIGKGGSECFAKAGGGGGGSPSDVELLAATLRITSRSAESIEGTLVVTANGESLSFKAPIVEAAGAASPNLCCFR